jgi:hypothetical protein
MMSDQKTTLQPDDLIEGAWYTIRLKEAVEPVQRGRFVGFRSERGRPLVLVFLLSGDRKKHFAVNGIASIN